jgi:hypothetical protein
MITFLRLVLILAWLLFLFLAPVLPAFGQSIGVRFQGSAPQPMLPAESAGVVAQANWNNAQNASGSLASLTDSTGAVQPVSITWTCDDGWRESYTDAPGNPRLMLGYLDNGQQHPSTIAVSGLPAANMGYTLYVYANGANTAPQTNTGNYSVAPGGEKGSVTYSGQFAGTFTAGANYLALTLPAGTTTFTLTATPGASSTGNARAPVNAIQLVPVGPAAPPPAAAMFHIVNLNPAVSISYAEEAVMATPMCAAGDTTCKQGLQLCVAAVPPSTVQGPCITITNPSSPLDLALTLNNSQGSSVTPIGILSFALPPFTVTLSPTVPQ